MDNPPNLDLGLTRKPKNVAAFNDSSNGWLAFRKIRFASAGDGKYATIRNLDLSNYDLNNFPANHIAFVQCNLDGTSFRNTRFTFKTAFINCSLKNADFASTVAADALFINCDLTGVNFWTKMGWATQDLDGNTIPSVFADCKIDPNVEEFLLKDGNITNTSKLNTAQRLEIVGGINEKLVQILNAPVLDL